MDCAKTEQREILHPTTSKLINLLESSANQCLNFVQLDEFTEAYKNAYSAFKNKNVDTRAPLAGSSREAENIRNIFHKDVLKFFKDDVTNFIESEDLDRKLRELDEMKIEFKHLPESKKAWRPPGDVENHMKPFNKAIKIKERDCLIRQVKAEREKLNILKSRVEVFRKRTLGLNETVERNKAAIKAEIVSNNHILLN